MPVHKSASAREEFTTIAISDSVKNALAGKKVHRREPWNDVLKRVLGLKQDG